MVKIDKIFITGNKKTKDFIIKRELSIEEGKMVAYEDLEEILRKDRQKISNTRLFVKVEITALPLSNHLYDVLIEVSERWYVIPSPIFQLADRNFNDWWVNQNRDISRVNLGFKFTHYNFRGRSEKLSLLAQFGYARNFAASYYVPYIDRTRKNGMGLNFSYSEFTNVPVHTIGHKREFIGIEELERKEPLRENYSVGLTFTRRASFYNSHSAFLSFNSNHVADTILKLNPNYLLTGNSSLRHFNLSYYFRRDLRDAINYPLKGFMVVAGAAKRGLGIYNDINLFSISASYNHHFPLGKKFYFSNAFSGRLSTPSKQPYQYLTGIGYGGEVIRGYDLYVIEGQHHFLNKTELKFQILKKDLSLGYLMPIEQFKYIPIAVYPKLFFDAGYVVTPQPYPTNERFTNIPLWGGGIGLDVVSFYDFVIRMEYAVNSHRERGFFLNFKAGL